MISDRNQDLSEFDSDDDFSVASYETAPEEPDLSDDRNPNSPKTHGMEWAQLIQTYGSNPGAFVKDANAIEAFDMILQSKNRAAPIIEHQWDIENFSSATLKFMMCPNPQGIGVRIEGSLQQAYLAIQACNALVADVYRKSRIVWITLCLEGPHMLPAVAALRDGLQHHLSRDKFVNDDALHISAACVRLKAWDQWDPLVEKVGEIAELLNEALKVYPMAGHLSQLGSCDSSFISVIPTTEYDPINTIVYTIRELLSSKYGYEPHMTLFANKKRPGGRAGFDASTLENLGLSWNLGYVQISKIQVSRQISSLSGGKYITVGSYPISPYSTI